MEPTLDKCPGYNLYIGGYVIAPPTQLAAAWHHLPLRVDRCQPSARLHSFRLAIDMTIS